MPDAIGKPQPGKVALGKGPPAGPYVMRGLAQLRALTHPRHKELIKHLFDAPKTATQLGVLMRIKRTRVYYHLHALERMGLIRVVATRRRRRFKERFYQAVARTFTLAPSALRIDPEVRRTIGQSLDTALESTSREVHALLQRREDPFERKQGIIYHNTFSLPPEKARVYQRRFEALLREIQRDHSPGLPTRAGLTLAYYPFETAPERKR